MICTSSAHPKPTTHRLTPVPCNPERVSKERPTHLTTTLISASADAVDSIVDIRIPYASIVIEGGGVVAWKRQV